MHCSNVFAKYYSNVLGNDIPVYLEILFECIGSVVPLYWECFVPIYWEGIPNYWKFLVQYSGKYYSNALGSIITISPEIIFQCIDKEYIPMHLEVLS